MVPGDLRIGDADREAAAAYLREHYAQGRLTLGEFIERLDAVFAATVQSQLRAVTDDLPPAAAAPVGPLPSTAAGAGRARGGRGQGAGARARLGGIGVIIAALAAWLLVTGLQLRFWPGRLAIFLMVLAAVRWLMRLLWRFGWGGGPMGCGRYRGGR